MKVIPKENTGHGDHTNYLLGNKCVSIPKTVNIPKTMIKYWRKTMINPKTIEEEIYEVLS